MEKINLKIVGDNNFFMKEAFNALRTNIQFSGNDIKSIVITSCGMNEGKTVVALNVARSLSELGKRVLLLDADMRKSVIAGRNTNAVNPKGLSEILTGQIPVRNAMYNTQYRNLDIVFSGNFPPNPVKLLDSSVFDKVLDIYREQYDYIIVDAPPLGMVIDAAVISAKCDSAIFVIGDSSLPSSQAQEVVNQLQKSGCNVLGVVMNDVSGRNKSRKRYGYY